MPKLLDLLKRKFKSPREAMAALGLDPRLLQETVLAGDEKLKGNPTMKTNRRIARDDRETPGARRAAPGSEKNRAGTAGIALDDPAIREIMDRVDAMKLPPEVRAAVLAALTDGEGPDANKLDEAVEGMDEDDLDAPDQVSGWPGEARQRRDNANNSRGEDEDFPPTAGKNIGGPRPFKSMPERGGGKAMAGDEAGFFARFPEARRVGLDNQVRELPRHRPARSTNSAMAADGRRAQSFAERWPQVRVRVIP
jgi:hypothetical protein